MTKHYIAMAGLHGFLPQTCEVFDTARDAADFLADVHELGKNRRAKLQSQKYLELNLKRDGNEYAEIKLCECDNPDSHSSF
jgi:hypothetical protein